MDSSAGTSLSGAVVPRRSDGREGGAPRVCRIAVEGLWLTVLRGDSIETAVDAEALLRSEDPAEPPYWMHLWPGALALARIVARAPEVRPGAILLELGAGLALPSIAAAVRGATVVTSDWERSPLALAVRSARRNGRRLHAIQMDLRQPAVRVPCDIVLGAEVSYDERQVAALVDTTARLLRPGGVAWFSDSVNTYRTTLADGLRGAGLRVRVRSRCEPEEGRPVWVRMIEARQS